MKLTVKCRFNARKSGGLFIGGKLHFPIVLCDNNNANKTWQSILIEIGFFLFTVNININYAFKYINFN